MAFAAQAQAGSPAGTLKKRVRMVLAGVLALTGLLVAGCSSSVNGGDTQQPVRIGTLATEDFLPMWVAEDKGYVTGEGAAVEITVFQSAQELSTALASNSIDGAMTDIPVAANLSAAGSPMTITWTTLGAVPQQGRFGVMVGPNSDVTSLTDLAGVPIGVGSGTMLEYVMDRLMAAAGIPEDQIVKEELKKLPVRYQLVMEGQTKAGVFPASLLALGEAQGGRVIADDTSGENLSMSVMAFRTAFAQDESGKAKIQKVQRAWDRAVDDIAANPEDYRNVLIEDANLSEVLQDTYPIPSYPKAKVPSVGDVDPVLQWMVAKGYLDDGIVFDQPTGELMPKRP